MQPSILVSLVLLVAIAAIDVWVYLDSTSLDRRGRTVVARLGGLEIERPEMWLLLVVVLWILFFPLYLVARRAS